MKKISLSIFCLITVCTLNMIAQETISTDKGSSNEVELTKQVLQNYIKISSLPTSERRDFFADQSASSKADLFKLHLALQIAKRQSFSAEQKETILQMIQVVSSDSYDKTGTEAAAITRKEMSMLEQKARTIFSKQEGAEIFASLGGDRNDSESLRRYQDISVLPRPERKTLFSSTSARGKSELWRVHLALYLAIHSKMTMAQKGVILEAITLATPELYSTSPESPEWRGNVEEPMRRLTKLGHEVFSKREGAQVFDNLGGGDLPVCSKTSKVDGSPDSLQQPCQCSGLSDWCWNYCAGVGCRQTADGCGTLWQYPCDHNECH